VSRAGKGSFTLDHFHSTLKAYKYKLRPSAKIIAIFESWLAICCELYNAALQERRDAYKMAGESLNYASQCAELPALKAERQDVGRVHAQVLQNVLKRVAFAFDGFFRRVKNGEKPGYPRFRSRNRYDSFTFPQARGTFRLADNKLHLSKIGKVKVHLSRPIDGVIKTCTIKREADGWYVVFVVEENQSRFFPKTGDTVGIDVGIENFATFSTGAVVENPQFLRESEASLKTAQRRVSRRSDKRSNRRRKAIKLLAKKQRKIRRQRADFHHKTAIKIVREFDTIAVEDLNVEVMVKNHYLAKSISDAGWIKFISILTSKAESAGRVVIKVDPSYTSQDCSQCGYRMKKSLALREHRCIRCSFVAHRDHNAAINIKGRAVPSGMGAVALPRELRTFQAADLESKSVSR
jgi:putative transposase